MRSLSDILKATRFLDENKKELIAKGYEYALTIHKGQKRNYSSEPIDVHVTRVALILAELGMAHETITAGLLHHARREGRVSRAELVEKFGETVAFLVEGATTLRDIKLREGIHHIENLRKLFVASASDIRILVLKLADRLDSMRFLSHIRAHRRRISRETMEIYVPLAYRLGLHKISREIEDLSFQYIEPARFQELSRWLKSMEKEHAHSLKRFRKSLLKRFTDAGLPNAETDMRRKGIYSLSLKIDRKEKDPGKIYDIFAVRVYVDTVEDCYRVLGIVHGTWRPLPGRIKDYIAFPKPNGYRSLHTTVFVGDGITVEVQIRTQEMHEQAEFGFASHLAYRERGSGTKDPQYSWLKYFLPSDRTDSGEKSWLAYAPEWLRKVMRVQSFAGIEEQVMRLKSDFFQHRMFIFDKRGDVIDLPIGATAIDFAYELDSSLANRLFGVRVNGKMVPIDAELHNEDIVEVLTRKSAHPTKRWLRSAKIALAKHRIQQCLDSAKKSYGKK